MVKHYTEYNKPKFNELLKVPERIPDVIKSVGVNETAKLIGVELTKFVQSYTVVRPMNEDQIAECSYALISTSDEDRLSLQDLIIFFEGAKQGKYGRVLDHIDQHVIFEMLEQYREERHRQFLNIKNELNAQYKGLGPTDRISESRIDEEEKIRATAVEYYKKNVMENNNG